MSNPKSRLASMSPDKQRVTLQLLPQKLAQGFSSERFHRLLTDFSFIEAKVDGVGIQPLIEDYDLVRVFDLDFSQEARESLRLIQNALRLSAEAITDDKTQLVEQLLGRLMPCESPTLQTLLNQAEQEKREKTKPWLRHVKPTLTQAQSPLLRTLTGHTDSVGALAVTPDGQRVVSGSWDTKIKIWNIDTGEELRTLRGHTNIVHSVAVTPNGNKVVSASSDKTIKIWDIDTGEELKTFNTDGINSIAITPDGEKIVSGSSDKTIKIWDIDTAILLKTLKGHTNSVDAVVISSDCKLIFSREGIGSIGKGNQTKSLKSRKDYQPGIREGLGAFYSYINSDINIVTDADVEPTPDQEIGVIKIWDYDTGFELNTLSANKSSLASVLAISADIKILISESGMLLKTWRLKKIGNLVKAKTLNYLKGHTRSIYSVAITPDGSKAISASHDLTLKVWDLEKGTEKKTITGHTNPGNAVAITPNGKMAISASDDHSIKIWDLNNSQQTEFCQKHNRKVTDIKIIDNGQKAISASWDNKLNIWNLFNGEKISTIGPFGSFLRKEKLKVFLSKMAGGNINEIKLSDELAVNSDVTRIIRSGFVFDKTGSSVPPIYAITLMPNERGIIAALYGGLMVCDLAVGNNSISSILCIDKFFDPTIHTCAITPDGAKVLFGVSPKVSLGSDAPDFLSIYLQNKKTLERDEQARYAFVENFEQNCFIEYENVLIVWNTTTGEISNLTSHKGAVRAIAITSNGQMAISASDDTTLKVWDLSTHQELHTLTGHNSSVSAVVVMPDGYRAISASQDATIKVWDLVTGVEVNTLTGHKYGINAISITPNGQRLASVSWYK
ncbi:MAG: WD40 repeat domain-containing protein, partial [Symploca sp. SIO2G7]|nr:WD40 repeat domain-containing protein [Symploca sp. SIO2G7]